MSSFQISFMEKGDIQESAKVLRIAMLNNPIHVAVFQSGQLWHLGPIGVRQSHQGLGIGSLLMERFCKEVDVCMAEAYLETDLDKNVRFYEKFGSMFFPRL